MNILVLEASTTSAKAMLYDTDTDKFSVESKAYTGNYDDVTIHKADNVYQQMVDLGRKLADGKKIDMISLSGTWHSLFLCDKQMKPVTPVYLWSYTGAAEVCKELRQDPEYVKRFYNKTGCMVNAIYPFFKLQLLKRMGYDLKEHYIMGQGTYNTYRLTGERVITECLASGTGILNTHTKQFDPELLEELGIDISQLSKVVSFEKVYPLTEAGAADLGLEPGIPVVPTNSDGGLNQVGVGAVAEGVMTFSVGTSGAIRLTTPGPILPDKPSTWCYMSPKAWLSGAATNGCCNCIDWFKGKIFGPGVSYADIEAGIKDYETNPVFLPFIFGERCPGWNDEGTGTFMRILPQHTAYDMYLSVQEGVLFNLYHCYKMLTAVNEEPRRIKFSGGILQSKAWTQMCADIFQKELEVDNNEHGSMLGGVVLAMELLGVIPDAKDYDPPVAKVIKPNPEKAEFYKKKFEKYLECYELLQTNN